MASGGSRGDVSPGVAHALDEMRAAVEKPRRIALLGSAPSSIKLAPFGDANWELWGCSPGCSQHLKADQVHSWFEIHAFDKNRADLDADYIAFMRAIRGPVLISLLKTFLEWLIAEENKQTGRNEAAYDITRKTAETESRMRDAPRPDDDAVARSLQDGQF
jgi:hypothetical protein